MNIVFFGNTKYSKIVEESLYKNFGLSLVVTLPDRIMGRKKELTPNPVKQFAINKNIPVIEAEKLDKKIIAQIKRLAASKLASSSREESNEKLNARRYTLNASRKPDFLVVADYGLILPKELLDLPKYAPLNVHHSLLPKYRGPSPAPTAILNGDKVTGVTVIRMNEQLDAGEILGQKEYQLKPDETTESLLTKLNELGAELVSSVVQIIELNKKVEGKIQDESKATFTKKIIKQDGYIDLENPCLPAGRPPSKDEIDKMVRAYFPWPNAWSILKTENKELRIKFLPGNIIQVEGKNPISIKDFLNGYPEAKELITKII